MTVGAMAVLSSVALAQRTTDAPPPSLVVTPATGIMTSGPEGGPFSPSSFQYHLAASSGVIRYSIRLPSWLAASSTSGSLDMNGLTVTFTVNEAASRLRPGRYGPAVAFTNVANGRGSTTRSATLIVRAPASAPATEVGKAAPATQAGKAPAPATEPGKPPPPATEARKEPQPPPAAPKLQRRPPAAAPRSDGGYLLDDQKQHLLDDRREKLLAR